MKKVMLILMLVVCLVGCKDEPEKIVFESQSGETLSFVLPGGYDVDEFVVASVSDFIIDDTIDDTPLVDLTLAPARL